MLTLLGLLVVAAPAWATETRLKPPAKPLVLIGEQAPTDAVHIPTRKKQTLTVSGPAQVTLTLIGLAEKTAIWPGVAGEVEVRVDRGKPQAVVFPVSVAPFTIEQQPSWAALTPQVLELTLPAGRHTIGLAPAPPGKLGYALRVAVQRDASTPAAVATAALAADAVPETPAADDDEPQLIDGPTAALEPAPTEAAGYRLVGEPPAITLVGPSGAEQLFAVSIDDGLELATHGPGRLLFDIHAHRDPTNAESMKPVIVGVIVDDVLLQTLSVAQPASPELAIAGASYAPSVRVTLQVPIAPGNHRVRLTLSDSAVLGASIRPRFELPGDTDEPAVLSAAVARAEDLAVAAPLAAVDDPIGVGLVAAAWIPTAFPGVGALAAVDANLPIPAAGPRVAAGLSAGYGRVDYNRDYADDRRASGVSRSRFRLSTAPLLVELRWSAPLEPPFGVELGVGGGVVLATAASRSAGGANAPGLELLGAGLAQATGLYHLGPGVVLARLALLASQPLANQVAAGLDTGGVMLALGYRLQPGAVTTP